MGSVRISLFVQLRNADHSSLENAAQGYIESALNQHLTDEEYHAALLEARKIAIDQGIIETLDRYNLDALVLPAWTEMSIYAAWARKFEHYP